MTMLNESQAYLAMLKFLENYYGTTKSEEIGALLGGMALLPDGSPPTLLISLSGLLPSKPPSMAQQMRPCN